MRISCRAFVFAAMSIAPFLGLTHSPCLAQTHKIETKVFVGNSRTPIAENVTLISPQGIYDFRLSEPAETTIFEKGGDATHGMFVLLDHDRRVQTQISAALLLEFVARLKTRAAKGGPLVRFQAEPDFEVEFDPNGQHLSLAGPVLKYVVIGEGVSAEQSAAHREFVDWFARLNTTQPGAAPPHARLALNRELAQRRLVPKIVELTIPSDGQTNTNSVKVRSEHQYTWQLDAAEFERRRREVEFQRGEYKRVGFDVFRQLKVAQAEGTRSR